MVAREKVQIPNILTISWLREKYLSHEITPEEVMEEIIQRSLTDAGMNIWITPPSLAIMDPYLHRLHTLDMTQFALWGIPFAVKDNIDVAGVPTTAACPEYAFTPNEHALVVERLIDAGAVPVGKTNMDQFATGLVGVRSPYGETHNGLQVDLISGGSSSGSAVAVARGQAAFALGTDTAGSGRVPAALNNLVGFKPSFGAWPTKGVLPACASLDCVTVFAHSLKDALVVDEAARGIAENDPWSRGIPRKVSKRPEVVYISAELPAMFGPFANGYRKAWNASVLKLKNSGVCVEYLDTRFCDEAAELLYGGPFVAERWADWGDFIETNPGAAFPATEKVLRSGASEHFTAASAFRAIHRLQQLKLEARKQLKDAVLMMPTCGGTWTRQEVRLDPIATNSAMGKYTNHCNLLDLCAAAVPAGEAASQVPFGVTFFALAENEDLVCGAADIFLSSGKESILVAVCGLHKRGYPLEKQMHEAGARFVMEAKTSPNYQLVKLSTVPPKPGLIKRISGGGSIEVELWEMPSHAFGPFAAAIPSPLGIGKIELFDGTEVPGFLCEAYAAEGEEDITDLGSWR